jgi:hypothetical protein
MKKEKMFLAAIAVLGIVGGVVAFKAKDARGPVLDYYTCTSATQKCTTAFSSGDDHLYTTHVAGSTLLSSDASITSGVACTGNCEEGNLVYGKEVE